MIDATTDAPLTAEQYQSIRGCYWVLAWKNENRLADWHKWRMQTEEPPPVPNPRMVWRRPTYEEACYRQLRYLSNPSNFFFQIFNYQFIRSKANVLFKHKIPSAEHEAREYLESKGIDYGECGGDTAKNTL